MKANRPTSHRIVTAGVLLSCAVTLLEPDAAVGKATTAEQARSAVGAWLAMDATPLGVSLGRQIKEVRSYPDAQYAGVYYVVLLEPTGLVIVSGDDCVEPIIGFASANGYEASAGNPLGALVINDVTARMIEAQAAEAEAGAKGAAVAADSTFGAARAKWSVLLGDDVQVTGLGSVSDVRVAPLVQTHWSQDTECWPQQSVYNYYTPPGAAGSVDNYPTGCVATAMAQLMRFHQHPTAGVGTPSFSIAVCNVSQSRSLRGGNGSGGPYNWSSMPLDPDGGNNCASLPLAQRQAIGALCHDAGVAVGMNYCSGGSGAVLVKSVDAFKNTFQYSNAIKGYNNLSNIGAGLNGMANPNLDAGFPVLLGMRAGSIGHAVVCDGYGYNASTLYHHLNMGWWGQDDAWYNLPTVDTRYGTFTTITDCVYNVYVSGQGEIISGRVTDSTGQPIAGATVTGQRAGGGTYSDTSDARGIYALAKVPSASTYTVSVSKAGYQFTSRGATTGTSSNYAKTSGNCSEIDFVGTSVPAPPTVGSITPNSGCHDGSVAITDLAGTGFQSGASVGLTRAGETDIAGTGVNVIGTTKITCTFNLSGRAVGFWNVAVSNPDGQSDTMENGFLCHSEADFEPDADVDLADFLAFQGCFNGPNRSPQHADCGEADMDHDSDVDLSDFLDFQACFNGPNRLPKC